MPFSKTRLSWPANAGHPVDTCKVRDKRDSHGDTESTEKRKWRAEDAQDFSPCSPCLRVNSFFCPNAQALSPGWPAFAGHDRVFISRVCANRLESPALHCVPECR